MKLFTETPQEGDGDGVSIKLVRRKGPAAVIPDPDEERLRKSKRFARNTILGLGPIE